MLEDLKARETEAAREERERQREQSEYDEALRRALTSYAPLLETFCQESGWLLLDRGIAPMNDSAFNYSPPSNRCLLLFLEGPEKPVSNREYSGTTRAGMNLFLWFEMRGLFFPERKLYCATTCTMLGPYEGEFHRRWMGIDRGRLQMSLRGAFSMFGSRAGPAS